MERRQTFRQTPHSTPSTQYSYQSSARFYRSEPVEKRPRVPLRSTDANATYRPNQRLFDRESVSFNFDTSSDDDVDEIQAPISEPASAAANQSTPLAMVKIFNLYMTLSCMHNCLCYNVTIIN